MLLSAEEVATIAVLTISHKYSTGLSFTCQCLPSNISVCLLLRVLGPDHAALCSGAQGLGNPETGFVFHTIEFQWDSTGFCFVNLSEQRLIEKCCVCE